MPSVEQYHSSTPDWKQKEIADSLLESSGSVKVVFATNALSMGFDAAGKTKNEVRINLTFVAEQGKN